MNAKTHAKSVLYQKFVLDKEHSVKQTASKLNESPAFIYNIWERDRKKFKWEDVRRIAKATDDDDIYNLLLINTDRQVCKQFNPNKDYDSDDLQEEITDNLESLGSISKELRKALENNQLSKCELKDLQEPALKNVKEAQDISKLIRTKIKQSSS